MAGFKCPFCGQIMSVGHSTLSILKFNFSNDHIVSYPPPPHLRVEIYKCPNDDCKNETIFAQGVAGYIGEKTVKIFPESNAINFPIYVPEAIRNDYEEACTIIDKSPKASATLARRCLQGIIRDFWGIRKGRLVDEINELQEKVPPMQWAAIDAVRNIGNIGAHMEKDVNLIIDVEPDEAQKLLDLIELLIDKWYISRNEEEELYKSITGISAEKKAAKSG